MMIRPLPIAGKPTFSFQVEGLEDWGIAVKGEAIETNAMLQGYSRPDLLGVQARNRPVLNHLPPVSK